MDALQGAALLSWVLRRSGALNALSAYDIYFFLVLEI